MVMLLLLAIALTASAPLNSTTPTFNIHEEGDIVKSYQGGIEEIDKLLNILNGLKKFNFEGLDDIVQPHEYWDEGSISSQETMAYPEFPLLPVIKSRLNKIEDFDYEDFDEYNCVNLMTK